MIAQYFKKKREFVESLSVAGSGLGIIVMSTFLQKSIDALGWRYIVNLVIARLTSSVPVLISRYGLQCVTLCAFSTFFLGLFYRSAALYHPQRRAILHLKTQKRKVKEKNRQNNRMQLFDFKTLRSKTFRIILLSSALGAFGIYIPFVHLAQTVRSDKLVDAVLPLQTYMGIAWIIGAMAFGLLVTRNNADCRIGRQYLCQVSLIMCAICLLALTRIHANYEGYFIIVCAYGASIHFEYMRWSMQFASFVNTIFTFSLDRILLRWIPLFAQSLCIRTCSLQKLFRGVEFIAMLTIHINIRRRQFGRAHQCVCVT